MVVLSVFKNLEIKSHKGKYKLIVNKNLDQFIKTTKNYNCYFIIDSNIAKLYNQEIKSILNNKNTIIIKATENSKSIKKIIPIISILVKNKIRRGDYIIAIGGGVIQDITSFICSVLYRGISWIFLPTTLLAQADSCIGSKSSVNLGVNKNILGTYNPPKFIYLMPFFLNTLKKKELNSGLGEIIKVHIINGKKSFNLLSYDFKNIINNQNLMLKYIIDSLKIKKRYIEKDEFDLNIRNLFNYGHTFGHAIETATNFKIPHGIAVTIGMDIANFISLSKKMITLSDFNRMHKILKHNYKNFNNKKIPLTLMINAMKKDKKNTKDRFTLILPNKTTCQINKFNIKNDKLFRNYCTKYFNTVYSK